jgi:hypothetical protein
LWAGNWSTSPQQLADRYLCRGERIRILWAPTGVEDGFASVQVYLRSAGASSTWKLLLAGQDAPLLCPRKEGNVIQELQHHTSRGWKCFLLFPDEDGYFAGAYTADSPSRLCDGVHKKVAGRFQLFSDILRVATADPQ